ncbi:MAG: hypothetical protein IJV97_03250 [Alphaproteobacteria bacterium]|nr:hypothetical protein [Alphaproteobacteria bacterium]
MVKAITDRVFIRLESKPSATAGGIFFTEDYQPERTIGIVESIGPEVKGIEIGDKVLFHIFDELPTYDPDVVVVRQNSILGVFEDE